MARQFVLTALVLAAAGTLGCTTCRYPVFETKSPAECPDVSAGQRNRVHIFLVNGADVLDMGGLAKLRDRLNEAGYSQGYYGYAYNCGFFGREMRRITRDDPFARFVVIGYEVGCGSAVSLAADARRYGVQVDAVVLLDPAFVGSETTAGLDAPIHVIQSQGWAVRESLTRADTQILADTGHFSVPTAEPTVCRVVGLLREATGRVADESSGRLVLPLFDDPPPPPEIIPDPVEGPPAPASEFTRQPTPAAVNPWLPTQPAALASRSKTKP